MSIRLKKNNYIFCDFNRNWVENTAATIFKEIKRNYEKNGMATIMTVAGKAAMSVHCKLSEMIIAGNLKNIRIFLADERCVSQYHYASNYRGIKKIYSFAKGVHVYKFYNTQLSPEKSLKRYQRFFQRDIDVLILGLANDGHIASLFSGRNVTNSMDNLFILKRDCDSFERLTINYSFIDKKCKKVYLLVNNILKKRIVMRVALKSDESSPLFSLFQKEIR